MHEMCVTLHVGKDAIRAVSSVPCACVGLSGGWRMQVEGRGGERSRGMGRE